MKNIGASLVKPLREDVEIRIHSKFVIIDQIYDKIQKRELNSYTRYR